MFYDNLKKACGIKGVKITPTIKACGGSPGAAVFWKDGVLPKGEMLVKLAKYLDVSTDFLLFGKELTSELTEKEQSLLADFRQLNAFEQGLVAGRAEMLIKLKQPVGEILEDFDEQEDEPLYLEYYAMGASAGTGIYLQDSYSEQLEVPRNTITEQANFAVKVVGDSMEPKYQSGDVLLVKSMPAVDVGQIGVFVYDGEGYVKKFGGDRLISLNPNYGDIKIKNPDSFYIRGRVIGKISVENQ